MIQKSEGLAGGGTPNEAKNIIYLSNKRSTKRNAAKAQEVDALKICDYLDSLASFADDLKSITKPGRRRLVADTMRCILEDLIADCGGAEVP